MVVNIMCNKALEYVTSFTGIPKYLAKKISNEAALFVKHAVPVRSTVSTTSGCIRKKKRKASESLTPKRQLRLHSLAPTYGF